MRKHITPALVSAGVLLVAGCAGPSGGTTAPPVVVQSDATRAPLAVSASASPESAFPNGVAWAIPGTIAFDNYDLGGPGVAWHTSRTTNPGGQYRQDGVGIEKTTDTESNGFDVGWNGNGFWYKYSVAVAQTAPYTVAVRVASVNPAGGPATFHLEDETGTNLTGEVTVPVTGGFQKWSTVSTKATLTSGSHTIKMAIDTGNASFNLTTMTFSSGASPAPSPSSSASPAPSPTATSTTPPSPTPLPSATAKPTPLPSATPTAPPVTNGLPTTIVNNSGIAGYYYMLGSNAAGVPMHMRPDGTVAANSLSDRGPDGHVDYSVPIAANGPTTFTFPHLNGRMYVSVGAKLQLSVNAGANGNVGVSTPVGWNPHDANYGVIHDWVEYAYTGTAFNVNVTGVDMYGLPLAIKLDGSSSQQTGSVPGARSAIFAALRSDPNFAGLVLSQNGIDLRALAPIHGSELGLFSNTFLDPYINAVWNFYTTHTLTVAGKPGVVGSVDSNGNLAFTKDGAPFISFAKPKTLDVLACNGAITAPNTAAGGMAPYLCSALNRGTAMLPNQPDNNPADFYNVNPTNVFSRVLHQFAIGGKAYGFAFDDFGGFSSFIADGQPRAFTITIQQF